jgi:predicted dehydrogenase
MAPTGDLAAEMVAAAQQANRVLEIAFNHRRRADVQFLRRYLDDQPLGAIYHARARWTRRTGIPGIDSWFTSKTMAGGGALIDLGSHVLDIALHLLGEPRVTRASGVTYNELGRAGRGGERNAGKTGATGHLFDVEDFASALLRLDNGRSLQLEASWAGYTNDHDDIGIDLLGDRGGVRLFVENYAAAGTVTIYSDIDGHRVTSRPEIATPSVGHGVVVQGFVDTIRSGQWQASHGEYGLHRSRVLDAVYESAREGTEVAVK